MAQGVEGAFSRAWGRIERTAAVLVLAAVGALAAVHAAGQWARELATAGTERVTGTLADAFVPTVRYEDALSGILGRTGDAAKVVVLTQEFGSVDSWCSSERLALWGQLDLGRTSVRVSVTNCAVQYYLPFREIRWAFEPSCRELRVTLPEPVLDAEMVRVPADPAAQRVERVRGWARTAASEDECEARARAGLVPKLLARAGHRVFRERAWENACRDLQQQLAPLLRQGVRLVVARPERRLEAPPDARCALPGTAPAAACL